MFEVGEKIVCTNNTTSSPLGGVEILPLTVGKMYIVTRNTLILEGIKEEGVVGLIDDKGRDNWYTDWKFISLPKYRKIKIEGIMNEISNR